MLQSLFLIVKCLTLSNIKLRKIIFYYFTKVLLIHLNQPLVLQYPEQSSYQLIIANIYIIAGIFPLQLRNLSNLFSPQ